MPWLNICNTCSEFLRFYLFPLLAEWKSADHDYLSLGRLLAHEFLVRIAYSKTCVKRPLKHEKTKIGFHDR